MDQRPVLVDDVYMFGQDGRAGSGWVAGIAGLLAVVLLAAVGVAALRSDTASADTVLARGSDARVVLADGSAAAVEVGDRIPTGATVTAGRTGAELETRDRVVHLGGGTEVTVRDGVRQVLRRGFVLVDASDDAPGVELETTAATVTTADDSLVRVDGGLLVRVGVLRGDAAAVRPTARRTSTELPTYYQVQVAPGALPGASTPFVLTPGDAYERLLASDLVSADEDLTALASRLDTDGSAGRVVMTALRSDVPAGPALAAGAPGSEGTLGYLIATAAPGTDPLVERYAKVRGLRELGGSWGVVAAIVRAEVGRVGAALGALLDPDTVPVLAGGTLDLSAVLDPSSSTPGDEPAAPADPSEPGAQPRPTQGSGGGNAPQPTASPTPAPGPADPVVDVVEEVVDTVLDLVSPSPSSTPLLPVPLPPVPAQLPAAPSPVPTLAPLQLPVLPL